jgi:DNA-binding Xre family transcriptional regulator
MSLYREINRYIEENKISQKMLAQKADMTEVALCLSLNGKRKLLADEYIKICNALCLTYDKFTEDQAG